jgi:hypothetical protein
LKYNRSFITDKAIETVQRYQATETSGDLLSRCQQLGRHRSVVEPYFDTFTVLRHDIVSAEPCLDTFATYCQPAKSRFDTPDTQYRKTVTKHREEGFRRKGGATRT